MVDKVWLDKKAIEAITLPDEGKRITVWDTEIPGFGVRVTSTGAKSFILSYWSSRSKKRFKIGDYPTWSASAARAEAIKLRKDIDRGEDPMAERQDERQAPTFKDLADEYLRDHAPKKRTGEHDRQTLDRHILRRFGGQKVADITHRQVEIYHRDRSQDAPTQANREIALLSKMFALAIKWGYRPDNPAKGIERNPENKRERYLSTEEISHLLDAMNKHTVAASRHCANLIRFLLLTGARRGETMSATWDQVDLETGVWIKPSSHTKQKKTHRVPLSAPALALLVDMKAKADAEAKKANEEPSKFLFPGRGKDHITSPKKYWEMIRERATVSLWASKPETTAGKLVAELTIDDLPEHRKVVAWAQIKGVELPAGITDVNVHDLRHSYASILASSGLSLPIIGQLLGHTQTQTTARYAHLFDDPLREATNRVGSLLDGLASGRSAEVTQLKGGRNG
ncbi:tyrosine-type recombinase/integrase [Paramagnetospirillum magnetotacticum]|nr:site-specific integrase [Paramagnetospirillum magnetotacticum]